MEGVRVMTTNIDKLRTKLSKEATKAGEDNDCAVRALAAVTGVSYNKVNKWLISNKFRKPRGGTSRQPYIKFLREHGFTNSRSIGVSDKTIRSFQQQAYKGKFLVLVRGHILAVIDGFAIDWADMRLHRIKGVIQVQE